MSEIPEGYKRTKGGVIPEEWNEGPISSIALVNPRTDTSHLKEGSPVSFLPMEKVGEDGTVHAMEVRPYAEVQNGYTIFTDGDILFAKITPCMENGKGALARDLRNGVGFGSTEFHVLRPIDPEDAEYIYQLSRSSSFRNKATRYFTGSAGQQRVSKDIFTHYLCPIPTPEERHRIAAILSTVDAAIAATDEVIAKTEDLKRGLMQDLLTKGIDEAGRVRSEETHAFCEKQGMRVPVEWDVGTLASYAVIVMGTSPPGDSYNEKGEGYPLINGPVEFGEIYPTPVQWTTQLTKSCLPGDILYCVRGSTTGRMNWADQEYCIGRGISAIRGKEEISDTFYIRIALEHQNERVFNIASGGGSTFPSVTTNFLKNLKLPFPPYPEQHRIATVLSTVDRDLAAERDHRARLQTLKKGLMQDLLTGRKRVPLDGGEAHGA